MLYGEERWVMMRIGHQQKLLSQTLTIIRKEQIERMRKVFSPVNVWHGRRDIQKTLAGTVNQWGIW